jgi:signal transduction histidine kinase
MTALSPFANGRDDRGDAARTAQTIPNAQAIYRRPSLLPSIIIAVLCVGAAVFGLVGGHTTEILRVLLGCVAAGAVAMLIAAWVAAATASRQVTSDIQAVRALTVRGQADVQQLADRLVRGERPAPLPPGPVHVTDEAFRQLVRDVEQAQFSSGQALLQVTERAFPFSGPRSDQRVEIFVNLARRMQSLVHREIELLDDLEAKVEDPDLLKGLFTVDHLATRMRRQSESLAVLGGSASRRQWTRQVSMHEVLRAAIAEVEQYSRVKVVPPVEGVLRGGAVSDVIHLIAELVENATKFSAPRTTALLRAQLVAAGLAIEVEDRGLGMLPADQQRMNALLADPGRVDVDELLRDGRIGLYVVSTLARRHGIRVQLQNNIFGGTQAVVVLPRPLLDMPDDYELPNGQSQYGSDEEPDAGLALVQATADPFAQPLPSAQAYSPAQPLPAAQPYSAAQPYTPAPPVAAAAAQPATGPQPITPAQGERPVLPRRTVQPSRAPEFRDKLRDDSAARHTEPPADQMTGLMADFLKGVSRSEEEDFPARD